eukprot:9514505-Lingulodinium_polyedra.AAC.1
MPQQHAPWRRPQTPERRSNAPHLSLAELQRLQDVGELVIWHRPGGGARTPSASWSGRSRRSNQRKPR